MTRTSHIARSRVVSQVKTLLCSYQTSDERIGRESQTFFLFPSRIHSRNSFPTNRSIRLSWRSNDIYPSPFTRAPSLLSSIDRSIDTDCFGFDSFIQYDGLRSLARPSPSPEALPGEQFYLFINRWIFIGLPLFDTTRQRSRRPAPLVPRYLMLVSSPSPLNHSKAKRQISPRLKECRPMRSPSF